MEDYFLRLPGEVMRQIISECGAFWWVPKLVSVRWSEEARIVWCNEMIVSEMGRTYLAKFQKDIVKYCRLLEGSVPSWDFYHLVEELKNKLEWLKKQGKKIPPPRFDCQLKHVYYIKPEHQRRVIIPLLQVYHRLVPIQPNTIITGETRISEVLLFSRKIECVRMVDLGFRNHTEPVICDSDEFPRNTAALDINDTAMFAYVGENWSDDDCIDYFKRVPRWYKSGDDFLRNIDHAISENKVIAAKHWMIFCSTYGNCGKYPELKKLTEFGLFPNLFTKLSHQTGGDFYYLSVVTTLDIATRLMTGLKCVTHACLNYFKRDENGKKVLCSTFQSLFAPVVVNIAEILQPMLFEIKLKPGEIENLLIVIHEILL